METLTLADITLHLLPEKAIYLPELALLLVADVHLGKSETFQSAGVPVPSLVNQATLDRLQQLCQQVQPKKLLVLGDLFHSSAAVTDGLLEEWAKFCDRVVTQVQVLVGNHDRRLVRALLERAIPTETDAIRQGRLLLSHEPAPESGFLNLCGHLHPCLRLQSRLDRLRLPCFYLDHSKSLLVLPAFGEFTGGYEVSLTATTTAYVVAAGTIVPLQ